MSPYRFSRPVTTFHGRRLPVSALPVGYAALIDAYGLSVPLPRQLSAIGERHKLFTKDNWQIFSPRYTPAATLEGSFFASTNRSQCIVSNIVVALFL